MSASNNNVNSTGLLGWIDARFPLSKLYNDHLGQYYAAKNFNFLYYFGSLALLVLVNQILTGVWLAMFYKPSATEAFASVEMNIMRDVSWGWLLRYMHSTGASAFFIIVYFHMFRGLIYGSAKKPRELIWLFGMLIFLVLMAEAFMGYLLPWGQTSYWGANVIISLFSSIPGIGNFIVEFIQGDYFISDATLNRFFSLHVILLPLVLVMLVAAHLIALHEVGSLNPDGIEIKKYKNDQGIPIDGIAFHPYYTVKDMFGVGVFLIFFAAVIFYFPDMNGYFLEHANFEAADPLNTPEHIAPSWYFGAFYSILRSATFDFLFINSKQWGVILMFAAIIVLFFLPWLDRQKVKSIRYRGVGFLIATILFVIAFIGLTYLGTKSPTPTATLITQVLTVYYFGYFLLFLPVYPLFEKTKPVPERVR